jgi:hypothetical protein
MERSMKKAKSKPETDPQVPASFRRLIATIRIPSIAEEQVLVAAANECADIWEEAQARGH